MSPGGRERSRRISEAFSPVTSGALANVSGDSPAAPIPTGGAGRIRKGKDRRTASPSDLAALIAGLSDGDESGAGGDTDGSDAENAAAEAFVAAAFDDVTPAAEPVAAFTPPDPPTMAAAVGVNTSHGGDGDLSQSAAGGSGGMAAMPGSLLTTRLRSALASAGPAHRVRTPGRSILHNSTLSSVNRSTSLAGVSGAAASVPMPVAGGGMPASALRRCRVVFGSPQAAEFAQEAPSSALVQLDKQAVKQRFKLGEPEVPFPLAAMEAAAPVAEAPPLASSELPAVAALEEGEPESAETAQNSAILDRFEAQLSGMENSDVSKRRARNRRRSNATLSGAKRGRPSDAVSAAASPAAPTPADEADDEEEEEEEEEEDVVRELEAFLPPLPGELHSAQSAAACSDTSGGCKKGKEGGGGT